jgi:bifunctional non-homologous end joining protein LigD
VAELPERLSPMLAVAGPLPPDGDDHAFELKWDGIRALARWDGTDLRLHTRNLREVTVAYPELAPLGAALGSTPVLLDGEIVAFDEEGKPSFQALQERMHTGNATAARRGAERRPVTYLLFDVVHLGHDDLTARPWEHRRDLLDDLSLTGPSWATSPAFVGEGEATLAAAATRGLEGVIAKRVDSPYLPGRRSPAWIKHKLIRRDDAVVGGWLPGRGGRAGRIGSLLLGVPHRSGGLRFVGGVGTGFTGAELDRLHRLLAPTVTPTSPFTANPPTRRDAVYVAPTLVVEVAYTELTTAGIFRHPSYKGVRIDNSPGDVDTGAWVGLPDT